MGKKLWYVTKYEFTVIYSSENSVAVINERILILMFCFGE